MDELTQDEQNRIDSLQKSIKEIEIQVEGLIKKAKEVEEELTPLEKAELDTTIAYIITSLFYIYLKTQGISTQDHPIKYELEQVKLYMNKVHDLVELNKNKFLKVDVEAAKRIILHSTQQINSQKNEKHIKPKSPSPIKKQKIKTKKNSRK
ncbi:sun-cor steroid hormone receptor co-repressor [Anaeramoeba ignava]|uniref:Nuclear nucleic acid-binding protein C1D n=1 Tax=Anaeramoeba ignava TaxID=1746090 RepID=A0A9Q0LQ15_ANAIG|nr:sun-cor steroid hormone receptor co-repressor [Anaeramoeba ignava]